MQKAETEHYPEIQAEIDRNFEAFTARLDEYMVEHEGEWALMKDRRVIGFYPEFADARRMGKESYPDHIYSIQQVTKTPLYLHEFPVRHAENTE